MCTTWNKALLSLLYWWQHAWKINLAGFFVDLFLIFSAKQQQQQTLALSSWPQCKKTGSSTCVLALSVVATSCRTQAPLAPAWPQCKKASCICLTKLKSHSFTYYWVLTLVFSSSCSLSEHQPVPRLPQIQSYLIRGYGREYFRISTSSKNINKSQKSFLNENKSM